MKIRFAHYSPNEWHQLFTKYLDNDKFEPVFNTCDKDCAFIWCGSASMLDKAFPASRYYRKPIIVWVWDLPIIFTEHYLRAQMYLDVLKQCNKVIAASKSTQAVLKQHKINADQMYFYVDTRDLAYNGKRKNQIIQISRFTPHKQFEIASYAVLNRDVSLVNIGFVNTEEFYYYKQLKQYASSNVIFKPDLIRKEMIKELQSSKILVSSSIFEGWGLSPIEAIFCGTPVILSNLPVFKEQYGDTVLYHNTEDPESLREQVQKLLADETLQKKIVKDAYECVKTFTPERFVIRWLNAVNQLLSS